MSVSEPTYKVDSKNDHYEIRTYQPIIVAETLIEADFDEAGSKAFAILADYIFGKNKSKQKMEMTAPVAQQNLSEKIAMTAPVSQIEDHRGHLVQFTMPSNYTMDTLPLPLDPRVKLKEMGSRTVAVYSYSGSWSESRYKSKLAKFHLELSKDKITTKGEPVFARYNSPFQLWFLRRNEIWLEISDR
ncbi:MAG: heme-binding protein [Pseudomonadota bacterium]